jgi:enediyne biosynthesis protein E4
LGKTPQVDKAVIRWPSGKVQTMEKPEVAEIHKVREPA